MIRRFFYGLLCLLSLASLATAQTLQIDQLPARNLTNVVGHDANGYVGKMAVTTPYLGVTATRGRIAYQSLGANSGTMSQTMHWSRDRMVDPVVIFGNFYVTNGAGEVTTGPGTLGASICVGDFTRCNVGSNYTLCGTGPRTIATTIGLNTIQCSGLTIPINSRFYVRMLQTNASGAIFTQISPQSIPDQDAAPDCWTTGNLSVTDMLTSGSFANNQCGSYTVFPLGIASITTRPSVVLIGDSKIQGGVDYATDYTGDIGNVARSIGPAFGYSNLGIGASLSAQYLANARTFRDAFVSTYFSHFIDNYCINDLATATTAAQCAANRASIAALYPGLIGFGTTIEPSLLSTDNFTTLANQSTPNAKIAAFNQLVRAGIAGEKGVFDIAWAIDPTRSNIWPVAPNPYATALSPVFSGTGSISVATPGILTITACTVCTLPIGSSIVGTNVAPGTFIAGYGTNVTSLGVCTATCTYTLGTRPASAVASTTITAGGFFTTDGLHLTPPGNVWLKNTGVVNPALITR
ncbi:hypothetical protein [Neorhizobium sp. NCHU2750]|uniref:hypothetical protein n=1 Tax=Neorhizobium sp. NCHU2750 TaxID=1825976 RepID=UPI000E721C1A|nr:hypothetical protein NCHU2750_27960 [Neorhizobium sp. NCHU2750]